MDATWFTGAADAMTGLPTATRCWGAWALTIAEDAGWALWACELSAPRPSQRE